MIVPAEAKAVPAAAADSATFSPDFQKSLDDYFKSREAKKKTEDDAKAKELVAKGLATGTKLPLQAYWDNRLFFETPGKEWRFAVGGRFQFEPVFWNQPQYLKGAAPGNGGLPAAKAGDGVGVLDDGMFFRRVRFRTDGVLYDKMEYMMEVNFEQLNFVTYDHLWVGLKDVPILGTVRIGQHKVPQGMEMIGNDYHLTLLERSSLADSHWTLFAPGIFIMNNYLDQHMVVQTMFHRIQPTGFFTSDFGGDPGRFVDTGYLLANHVNTVSPEFLWTNGPFSLQSEAAFSFVDDAKFLYGPNVGRPGVNAMFWGTYAEASYIFTGEHRGYDKRLGTFDRVKVKNALNWDKCGNHGIGAWQAAYRFSYLDLDDRGINGGQLYQHTFGLNWYLNDNAKVQFQYSNINRDVNKPANSGTVHGFGLMAQLYF